MPESETRPAPDVEPEVEPVQVVAPMPAELDLLPAQLGAPDGDPVGEEPAPPGLPDSLLPDGAYVVVYD